ncbi:glycerol kinase GlpK [Croceibacterium aestuarii]|uniref:glycerol kinase GlpK n=1 Tax=Croceibacterium aestuarii TaxID=3064139 RepID=UPI00272DD67C|nr:glycerol kinase GlpK [Croceibacterium sp. D39]
MTEPLILVLDEGTTSTRAMLFTAQGKLQGAAQEQLAQHYPRTGWVEHDAREIWDKTLACARAMVAQAGGAERIAAIGITNQRETVVAWDKARGEPLCRAVVWQDRRTAEFCAELRAAGHEEAVQEKTGLLLDPYFSGTKMRWLLGNDDAVAEAAREGRLALGTVDSWLVWKLTRGRSFITDASNASRTQLLALEGASWDPALCDLLGVPISALPAVVDNAGPLAATHPDLFGAPIPITGMAGDQQAATIGQGCLAPGETKATFGTGAFVLANKGAAIPRSANRLLGTVLHQLGGRRHYALEGSVFVAGSLFQWLRDSLQMIVSAPESEELARSVPDSAGVVVIPALSGLGAPHWRADARAAITGLSFAATRAHVVRAALEAISHQTQDLAAAFAADGAEWTTLRIDGGMSSNDWLAQDLAGLLQVSVVRPDFVETTALGAAMLAALGAGLYGSLAEAAAAMIGSGERFEPGMDDAVRQRRLAGWQAALAKL